MGYDYSSVESPSRGVGILVIMGGVGYVPPLLFFSSDGWVLYATPLILEAGGYRTPHPPLAYYLWGMWGMVILVLVNTLLMASDYTSHHTVVVVPPIGGRGVPGPSLWWAHKKSPLTGAGRYLSS